MAAKEILRLVEDGQMAFHEIGVVAREFGFLRQGHPGHVFTNTASRLPAASKNRWCSFR